MVNCTATAENEANSYITLSTIYIIAKLRGVSRDPLEPKANIYGHTENKGTAYNLIESLRKHVSGDNTII